MNQDYNYSQQPQYQAPQPQPQKGKGVSIAALVCGIVAFVSSICGFCLNPCLMTTFAAIICGIIGMSSKNNPSKGMAIAGLCLGVGSFFGEAVWAIFTLGMSLFI